MKTPGREDILDLALRIGRREGVGREWILWPSWVTPPAEGRCALAKAAAIRSRARAILAGEEKLPSWLQREDAADRRKETSGPSAAPGPPAAVTDFSGIDPPFSTEDPAFAVSPAGRAACAALAKSSADRFSPHSADTVPPPPAPPAAVTDFSDIDPPFSAEDLAYAVSPAGRAALASLTKSSADRFSPHSADTIPLPPVPPAAVTDFSDMDPAFSAEDPAFAVSPAGRAAFAALEKSSGDRLSPHPADTVPPPPAPPAAVTDFSGIDPPFSAEDLTFAVSPAGRSALAALEKSSARLSPHPADTVPPPPAPPAAVTDFSGIDPPFSAEDLAFAASAAGRAAFETFLAAETASAERRSPPPAANVPLPPAPPRPAWDGNIRLRAKPPRRRRAVSGAARREPSWQAVTDLAVRLGARDGFSRSVMLWPRWVSPPEDGEASLNIAEAYRRMARGILRGEEDAPAWMQREDEAARRTAAAARAEEAARIPMFPLPPPPPGARDVLRAAPLAAAFLLQRQAAGNVRARPPPVVWRVPRRSQAGLSRAAAPPAPAGHAGRGRSIPIPVRLFDNRIAV